MNLEEEVDNLGMDRVLYESNSLYCITMINEHNKCTCKLYQHTGYICTHILITINKSTPLQVHSKSNTSVSLEGSGRKRKRTPALITEDANDARHGKYLNFCVKYPEYGEGVIMDYLSSIRRWKVLFRNDLTTLNANVMKTPEGKSFLLISESEIKIGIDNMKISFLT